MPLCPFFSGEGHWARECPDKGDKGRKGGGKSWDRDRDKGKGYGGGYGGGKRSLACYNQFKSLEDSWNRDCSEADCTVALLCSAKTCRDHLMLEVHCAYSLAKEEEGIMMIEAILKRCGCIEFIDVKFSCSKMGSKALSCSQRIFPNDHISGHLRMLSREPCQWNLPIRSYILSFLRWNRRTSLLSRWAAVRFPRLLTVLRNTTTPGDSFFSLNHYEVFTAFLVSFLNSWGRLQLWFPLKPHVHLLGKGMKIAYYRANLLLWRPFVGLHPKDSLDCGTFLLLPLMQFDFPDTVGNLGSLWAGAVCLLRFPVAVALYKLWVVKVSKFGFANSKTDGHIPQWRKSLQSFSWILKGMHVQFFGETIDEETTSYLCKCYILHSTRSWQLRQLME